MPAPKTWRDAISRIPLHLLGFGLPYFMAVMFGGLPALTAAVAISARGEFDDWRSGAQTFTGALIDFLAQTLSVIPAYFIHP